MRPPDLHPRASRANARLLETVLSDYGVQGAIGEIHAGPVVTLYELEPAPGIQAPLASSGLADVYRALAVAERGIECASRWCPAATPSASSCPTSGAERPSTSCARCWSSETYQQANGQAAA